MTARRSLLILLVALGLFAGRAFAQTGLLIATSDSTFWVRPSGDSIAASAGPHIIVPRRDGFWRIGVQTPSRTRVMDAAANFIDIRTNSTAMASYCYTYSLWAARGGTAPNIAPIGSIGSGGPCDISDRTTGELIVHFVGPDYIGFTTSFSTDNRCGFGTSSHLMSLDSLARYGVAVVGGEVPTTIPRSAGPIPETERQHGSESSDFLGRGVHRRDGRWQFYDRWGSMCCACGGMSTETGVRRMPAADVTGFAETRVNLAALRARVPKIVDAHRSPDGRWIAAIAGDLVEMDDGPPFVSNAELVLLVDGGARIALRRPLHGAPVMVQWAQGAHVARWDDELRAMLSLPEPAEPPAPWRTEPPFTRAARIDLAGIRQAGNEIRFHPTMTSPSDLGVVHDLTTKTWAMRPLPRIAAPRFDLPALGDTVPVARGVNLVRMRDTIVARFALSDTERRQLIPLRVREPISPGEQPFSLTPARWTSDSTRVWIALRGEEQARAAVLQYDRAAGTLTRLGELYDPMLNPSALVYAFGSLWMGNGDRAADDADGLYRFSFDGHPWSVYSSEYGDLPTGDPVALAALAGAVWLSATDAVARTDSIGDRYDVRWFELTDDIDSVRYAITDTMPSLDPVGDAIDLLQATLAVRGSPEFIRALRRSDYLLLMEFGYNRVAEGKSWSIENSAESVRDVLMQSGIRGYYAGGVARALALTR